jgi:KRAB domain-containing zinc finger protein
MGIFQTLDRLKEAVDALLNAKSAATATSNTMQQNLKERNSKKVISCTICTKLFANVSSLKMHMRVHSSEKPHTCPQCKESFSRSSYLRSHLRRVHTGDTTFACSICTKIFGDSQQLQRHLIVHTGEKLHSCPHYKSFSHSYQLHLHLRVHNGPIPAPSVQSHIPNHLVCAFI